MEQITQSLNQLYKELELWQGMLDNAEMIHSLAKKGKEFSSDDVSNSFKQVKECKINCNRVQESINKINKQL